MALCKNPKKDFKRTRKLPFSQMILTLLCMEGGSLACELMKTFGHTPKLPSSSAFVQQREKILPEAFETLFGLFVNATHSNLLFNGYRLLAIDGTDIRIPTDSQDPDSFYPGTNGQRPYNLIHLNAIETVLTNLPLESFPAYRLKSLYALRWGIETAFRDLKHTLGLLYFHVKKVEYIYQEIFARLIMYNFSELITCSVVIRKKNRKYAYKANFSAAVHICRQFFLGNVSPPDVEALIARFISPIHPGRSAPRFLFAKTSVSFAYRLP